MIFILSFIVPLNTVNYKQKYKKIGEVYKLFNFAVYSVLVANVRSGLTAISTASTTTVMTSSGSI